MKLSSFVGDSFFFPEHLSPHNNIELRHGMLMSSVARKLSNKNNIRILEIGSWCGVSSLVFAEAIQRFSENGAPSPESSVLCIDSWSPYLNPQDLERGEHYRLMQEAAASDAVYHTFCHNAALGARLTGVQINHIRGESRHILPILRDQSFDLIYIDGSHYYDSVASDIAHAMRLVCEGGYICGDDLEGQLHEVDQEECARNGDSDFIRDSRTGGAYHPGVTLAVGRAFGEVSNYGGFWIMAKGAGGYEKVAFESVSSFPPVFLSAEDGAAFQQKMTASRPLDMEAPVLEPELIEGVGTYNIIRYRAMFYCIPHHGGPFNTDPAWLDTLNGWAVIHETLEKARAECRYLTQRRAERDARRRQEAAAAAAVSPASTVG